LIDKADLELGSMILDGVFFWLARTMKHGSTKILFRLRSGAAALLVLALSSAARSDDTPVTTIAAIKGLGLEEAGKAQPVHGRATREHRPRHPIVDCWTTALRVQSVVPLGSGNA
jgi:hypothetical protein